MYKIIVMIITLLGIFLFEPDYLKSGDITDQQIKTLHKEIQSSIICTCSCPHVLIDCSCGISEDMRSDITTMLEKGLTTKEEIIQKHIEKYGIVVLAAPQKEGFDLIAWIMPFAVILIAGTVIIVALNRWVSRNRDRQMGDKIQNNKTNTGEIVDPKYEDQLDRELDEH